MELNVTPPVSALGNHNVSSATPQIDAQPFQAIANTPVNQPSATDQILNGMRGLHEMQQTHKMEDGSHIPTVETVKRLPDGPASGVLDADRNVSKTDESDKSIEQLEASFEYATKLALAQTVASQAAGSFSKLLSTT